MSGVAVRVEGLAKTYRGAGRPALDGVTLEARAGRILVLLGASGSGKTSLLRILAGLETADQGRVVVGEQVVDDPRPRVPAERRGVGMVFQHLELWPHLTVAENVAFGLPGRPRGRAALQHPVVAGLAARVGIETLLDRRPPSLSGGERQRVAIARALAPDPGVLLYDEPLANLDPDRRADLRLLIRRLARERGATLVYVTHDAEEALEMGDDVVVLYRGRVVDRGAPEDLYRAPSTLEGARALGPVTVLPGTLDAGAFVSPLGRHETSSAAPGARYGVLRPEDVEPLGADGPAKEGVGGGGLEGTVVDSRPRGRDWSFTAEVAGVDVLGRSASRLAPGARVRLVMRRPVVAVVSEADRRPGGEVVPEVAS